MSVYETNTHSFIVKIWTEATDGFQRAVWRGQITHVASGERLYLTDLNQITAFVSRFLGEMGVEPGTSRRLKRLLKRLKRKSEL